MSPEQLKAKILAWASDDDKLTAIAKAIAPRINVLSDAVNWAGFYFQNLPNVTADDFTHKTLDNDKLLEILYLATWQLEALPEWSENNIYQTLKGLASHFDIKLKDFMQPFFVAIAGSTSGTPIMNAMYVIGADMTLARLRHACEVLGGFGKKKLKKLEEVNKSLPNFLDEA